MPDSNLAPLQHSKLIDPIAAAKYLLGTYIVRDFHGTPLIGRIVETEAYFEQDEASHSYRGMTPRTEVMFGNPGNAYVYFSYGVHWCMNVTVGPAGHGAAVLIRAAEPVAGNATMHELRKGKARSDIELANGPGKLTQAFAINKQFYGHDLRQPPLQILKGKPLPPTTIATATRIGISKAADALLRFYIKDSKYISKK